MDGHYDLLGCFCSQKQSGTQLWVGVHVGSYTSAVPCSRYCTLVLCFTSDNAWYRGISVCDTEAPNSERFVPIVEGPVAAAYRLPALLGT